MRLLPHWSLVLLLLSTLPAIFATAQDHSSGIAFARAKHLQHGINTAIWFAQAHDYSPERLRTFTTPDDIALIARMGFDHCRLSVDADTLIEWQRAGKETPFMTELDRAVQTMLDHHLSIIIDIHSGSEYKAELFQGTTGVAGFTALWRALAAHFAPVDPEHIFFEIMNEPEQNDPYRWQGIEATVSVTSARPPRRTPSSRLEPAGRVSATCWFLNLLPTPT
jgi:endoglucanase